MNFNPREFVERLRGGVSDNPITIALYTGLGLAILGTVLNFVLLAIYAGTAQQNITDASELRVVSQQIAKNALEAAAGNAEAFELLESARRSFQESWDQVKDADVDDAAVIAELAAQWDEVGNSVDVILRGEDTVLDLHEVADTLAQTVPALQAEYDGVVEILVDTGADPEQIAFAQRQSLLAERIVRSIDKVLAGGEGAVQAADSFGRDASQFGRVLNGMIEGDDALGISQIDDPDALDYLAEIASLFDEFVNQSVDEILATAPELFQVRAAADNIFARSQDLLVQSTALNTQFEESTGGIFPNLYTGFLLAGIAIALLAAIFVLRTQDARRRQEELEAENQRNQAAILRLLDELGDLADGDLTVQATVTEDFTGAIADSINFSIDQLRSLVQTINQTAVQVASAAQETQSTAMHLAEASEHQAQEIAGASAAVNEMAVSIDQVSANAAESAAVAERAVAIANKGAEVVQATIHGMDTIREQIQETSK
ncbi:MAG: type IV pili methyl-accepting chemotaxis transducer N-terminal domain-containing protein, partial [Alcanivoracaceae bacterium]|nr:type IV pili methyl-accepting chemotaxis transducer N-terminal domain-containing protein [Alcanivoracaceae bacterium]